MLGWFLLLGEGLLAQKHLVSLVWWRGQWGEECAGKEITRPPLRGDHLKKWVFPFFLKTQPLVYCLHISVGNRIALHNFPVFPKVKAKLALLHSCCLGWKSGSPLPALNIYRPCWGTRESPWNEELCSLPWFDHPKLALTAHTEQFSLVMFRVIIQPSFL